MDISLCIIDRNKGTLDYSGANNPLYLIQEGKLIKLNADKMPIGIHVTEQTPFTNHSVKIAKGDHIYLFSDGYADQFGGQKGKKFMYKPFQELLLRNCQKPMDVQHDILENTFLKWMGGHDQVDDVMVIGIKI
jgi:serine phosphatase RsbU (regulator of sigma subunit)